MSRGFEVIDDPPGVLILKGLFGELPNSESTFSGLVDDREGRGGLWMMNLGEVAEGDMMGCDFLVLP
jgi:hypothetical protein